MIFRTFLAACFSIVQRCCARSSPSGFRHFQTESARKIRARLRGRSEPARTEDPCPPARKFRGARAEIPRHPCGKSASFRAEQPRNSSEKVKFSVSCTVHAIVDSCKLCCKFTVHCNINYEGTFCSMQDSLSCLPSAYNTYMYMHEPYQCIFCTVSVAFSGTFCTDVSDFDTTDSVTFYAGETKTSFPFIALCDTEEEGNEVVRLVLEVQEQDQHRIAVIGNDHIEVVTVGKRHTTAIPVPHSSVTVNVNADRNHLQVTFISCQRRQTTHTHMYDCIFFTQLCIIHVCTTLYNSHTDFTSALLSTLAVLQIITALQIQSR